MAEKETFVQIVDTATGNVEKVTDLKEIEALSIEDKLILARSKTLYVVSHKLEPVVKVEMRKVQITPVAYQENLPPKPHTETEEVEQAEIPVETGEKSHKGRPKKLS